MPLNDATLNIGVAAMEAAITHGSIHTATPNTSGSNESSAARQAITWVTPANGDLEFTADLVFTGGATSGPALYLGLWSASSAGTFRGYLPLSGDTTFDSTGAYTVTAGTVTGTAS